MCAGWTASPRRCRHAWDGREGPKHRVEARCLRAAAHQALLGQIRGSVAFCFLLNHQRASSARGHEPLAVATGLWVPPRCPVKLEGFGWWLQLCIGAGSGLSPRETPGSATSPLCKHGDGVVGKGFGPLRAPGTGDSPLIAAPAPPQLSGPHAAPADPGALADTNALCSQRAGIHDLHQPADRGALGAGQQSLRQGAR